MTVNVRGSTRGNPGSAQLPDAQIFQLVEELVDRMLQRGPIEGDDLGNQAGRVRQPRSSPVAARQGLAFRCLCVALRHRIADRGPDVAAVTRFAETALVTEPSPDPSFWFAETSLNRPLEMDWPLRRAWGLQECCQVDRCSCLPMANLDRIGWRCSRQRSGQRLGFRGRPGSDSGKSRLPGLRASCIKILSDDSGRGPHLWAMIVRHSKIGTCLLDHPEHGGVQAPRHREGETSERRREVGRGGQLRRPGISMRPACLEEIPPGHVFRQNPEAERDHARSRAPRETRLAAPARMRIPRRAAPPLKREASPAEGTQRQDRSPGRWPEAEGSVSP